MHGNGEKYTPAGDGAASYLADDGSLFVQAFPGVETLLLTRVHSPIQRSEVDLLMDFFRQNFGREFYVKDSAGVVYKASFTSIPQRQHIRGPWWSVTVGLALTDTNLEDPE